MKWLFPFGLIGSVVSALFCGTVLTPLLVAALAAAGFASLADNSDLVVLPAVAAFLLVAYQGLPREECERRGLRPES